MNTCLNQALLIVAVLMATPWTGLSLEALSDCEMKQSVAQAGISIVIDGSNVEAYSEGLTFLDPDDSGKYIGFMDFHRLTSINNGVTDVNNDGTISPLTLDVGTYHNLAMVLIDSSDLEILTQTSIDSIDFCGTSLGSLTINSMALRSLYFYLGPHATSGVSFETGFSSSMDALTFQYNTIDALTISGLHIAESFSGSLEDPSTWIAQDRFRIGNVAQGQAATLDIVSDTVNEWTFTDTDGTVHTYANPRYNAGYLALDLSMEGSVRLENIRFGGGDMVTDLGGVVLDNINVEKLYIELPGRGLGKP